MSLSKGEQTRLALIDSAYALFLKQGYHGTSMRDIAKGADLALGGIYNHFKSKAEIFQAVILIHHPFLKIFPKLMEVEVEVEEGVENGAEHFLRSATKLLFKEIEAEPALLNLMFIELIELDGSNLGTLFPILQPTIFTFLQRLTALQPDWRIPSPAVFIRSYIGLIIGISITERFMPKALADANIAGELDDFLDIYLHGLFK